jgi:hypothetical protein
LIRLLRHGMSIINFLALIMRPRPGTANTKPTPMRISLLDPSESYSDDEEDPIAIAWQQACSEPLPGEPSCREGQHPFIPKV